MEIWIQKQQIVQHALLHVLNYGPIPDRTIVDFISNEVGDCRNMQVAAIQSQIFFES
jgi:hypothetical protein